MANARTVVTKGARGLADRGGTGNPGIHKPEEAAVPAALAAAKDFEIVLQSAKTGYIVQLTAPHDRYNELSGVRVKARPLYLSFAANRGFCKLDLRNAEDRRRWLYVVGDKVWAADMKRLKLPDTRDPQDGTDPIDAHPRYGMGLKFWKLSDMQNETQARKREALLNQLATDPEMADLILKNPDEIAGVLAKRREKLGVAAPPAKVAGAPGKKAAPTPDPESDSDSESDI